MYLEIEGFLTEEERAIALAIAEGGRFGDGLSSAPGATHSIKFNEQLEPGPEQPRLDAMLSAAILRSPELRAFTQAKEVRAPMLSRYTEGMHYGRHLDAPILTKGTPMRSDLSMTVFLAPPETYDGGSLVLDTDFGEIVCKPAAGTAICYSTLLWHEVEPVTRGTRLALVTWFQSRVRDPLQRACLHDLTMALADVAAAAPGSDAANRLRRQVDNLTRLWSDV
jgi:PKHD-type hydroxylase